MSESLHLAPFDKTKRIELIPASNGGWVVSAVPDDPRMMHGIIGAFSNSYDLLVALTKALTPSGDDKEAPHV
jgi:hypothetical protein